MSENEEAASRLDPSRRPTRSTKPCEPHSTAPPDRSAAALLAEALALVEQTGWRLFPTAGKVPAIPGGNGLHDATADPAGLAELFRRAPTADGFAVACGASGLAVKDLDVTPAVDGRDVAREAGLPYLEVDTVRALTPRGGSHIFFSGVVPSRTGVLPGIDIKSAGGYVVLPPAPGRVWEAEASPWDSPIAPVPAWLSELAQGRRTAARLTTSEWDTLVGDVVPEGRRHMVLRSLAGHLYRRYVDPAVVRALLDAYNVARCRPPQPEADLDRLLEDIAARELRRRGGAE